MSNPVVGIVMGSESDSDVMRNTAETLKSFNVPFEVTVSSAHRAVDKTLEYARSASGRGIKVIIAGAGAAAHLPGVLAAATSLPVIGVPIASTPLSGVDALLSMAQMPSGVPVATMAVGPSGAKNAAHYALRILALSDGDLKERLEERRAEMARDVEAADARLKSRWSE